MTEIDPSVRYGCRNRYVFGSIWFLAAAGSLSLYVFARDVMHAGLQDAFSLSLGVAYVVYLLLGSVRAFTFIPSAYLLAVALPFFPPLPLFVLTLTGVMISSTIVYYFSEELHLADPFKSGKHQDRVARLRTVLTRYELPIIVGWSFCPLAPTDLICCVCGALEIKLATFLMGILLGEGSICAIYIFAGDLALRAMHIKP